MERFDAGREHDAELHAAHGPGPDPLVGGDPPGGQLVPDQTARGDWSESVWSVPGDDVLTPGITLFADPFAEAELRREMRLSELWDRCRGGSCTLDEFFELSALVTEVEPIRGSLCSDCAMLDRPSAAAHWALAGTMLCRGHLRFHLGHARLDGDGGARHT